MTREDKLLKIIEGLQETIRKLESERITWNDPFPYYTHYPYQLKWAHPVGCNCYECNPFVFPTITCTGTSVNADKFTIGSVVDEVS